MAVLYPIDANGIAKADGISVLRTIIDGTSDRRNDGDAPNWPTLDDAAYHGVIGEVVKTISPHTEADPIAVLVQVLTYFGNVIGRLPHYRVEADYHHTNLFVVLVGQSAKGRKGTSGGRAKSVMLLADEAWAENQIKGGLSSGEGLISEVRDPMQRWNPKDQQFETLDPGVVDKRLMVVEAEFANALAVMERPGNTLSPVVRKAWDGLTLQTLTKNTSLKASGSHISIIGHITEDELRSGINRTDMANGFANRFLFVCVRRSKLLPFGGALDDAIIHELSEKIKAAADVARITGRVSMTDTARREWAEVYAHLSNDQPGLLGAITARAEAQVIRLAMIYALLDRQDRINVPHLKAALAIWEYCEASAARIFGQSLGDPIADEILQALRQAGGAGMTRTAIRDLFGRNRSGDRIGAALQFLFTKGRARMEQRITGGRPSEIWFAAGN